MGLTPILKFPYPEPTDSVDVVRDIKALAMQNELLTAGAQLRMGTVSVTTNINGDTLITFGNALPNSLTTALVCDAGNPAGAGPLGTHVRVNSTSSTRSSIAFRAYDLAGAPLANTTIIVTYIAVGT